MGTVPNNLPLQLSSFIGREPEMAEVRRLLSTSRLVTLTGVGGCGKTRLAIEVARHDDLSHYQDGVWLIELAALADPGLVTQTVAKAVGVAEQPGRPLVEALVDFLRAKQLLLVLDNCEHVLEAAAQLTALLLQVCPHLHILVTSREVLNLNGELAWIVPSLAVPSRSLPPANLDQYDAIRLFVERASAVLPGFTLTVQNAATVAQICQRLDGIPLAIELAAARVKMLSTEQIAMRLDDVFALLTAGKRMAPQRHQTLRATMGWSYNLLPPPEQTLFRRLSVFAGGWTLEAVEAVCAGEDIAPGEVLNLLSYLIDKSLVVKREPGQAARYGLLETVRQYGVERLLESGETDIIRRQHANFFLRLAETAEPKLMGPEQGVWLARLETEHDNLRAALLWIAENEQVEMGLRLGGALWWFWSVHGHLSEGQRWLEKALAKGHHASASARAKALLGAGYLAGLQIDYPRAVALSETSLTLYREQQDKHGIALALTNLWKMALDQANYGQATIYLEEDLALFQDLGDLWGIITSLSGLGNVAYHQGDHARARTLYEESLTLGRKWGDRRGITISLINLSEMALEESDYDRATMLLEESLALGQELGDKELIAVSWEGLARVAGARGQPERSAHLFGAAEALFEAIGMPLLPTYRAEYERKVAAVRAQLDEATFNVAWAAGRAMTLEQASAYALAEPSALPEARSEPVPPAAQAKRRLFGLTGREREVAVLIAHGQSNRAIAAHLVVTERTVETHVSNILSKLGFTSRSQIAAWAVEKGLTQGSE